jgi:N-acetylmuramoyl-L-alanine amidase CwlA
MAVWKPIVGKSFSAADFDKYCQGLKWTSWRPTFIALHNTGVPALALRPDGFTAQHIKNLESYYKGKGWSAGPHLFIDDKQIWAFTPLNVPGVHSPSWNSIAIGVEMLGDYAKDAFNAGRGLAVRRNSTSAVASISRALGLDPQTMKLHKEDKATDHDCPGKNVIKADFITDVKAKIAKFSAGDHDLLEPHPH